MAQNQKESGTVKFFNETKGFGFIKNDISGEEHFVHATGLVNKKEKLRENDNVEYQIVEGKRGPMAVDVELV